MVQSLIRTASTAAVFGALVVSGAAAAGCGTNFKVSEQRVVTAPLGATQFSLSNDVGDVVLVASDDVSEITAAVQVTGKGTSTARAREVLDHLTLVLEYDKSEGGLLVARVDVPKKYTKYPYAAAVDWEIVMPTGVALELNTDVGDIEARGFVAGADVRSDVGDIELVDMRGGVTVKSDVGDITIIADGEIVADSDVGDISVTVVDGSTGDVIARSDVGDVLIEFPMDRVGHIHARTDVGSVSSKLDGASAKVYKDKRGELIADLGGQDSPTIDAKADVGSVRVKTRGASAD